MIKVAFFDTKDYDKNLFEEYNKNYNFEITYFTSKLNNENAITTTNKTTFGETKTSALVNTGSITVNGTTIIAGAISGVGALMLNDSTLYILNSSVCPKC